MANRTVTPYTGGRSQMRGGGFTPFSDLQREMNRLFDDVFGASSGDLMPSGTSQGMWMTPRIDISEANNEVRICAEVPGVSPDQVEVIVEDDVLTIRGEKKAEADDGRGNYHLSERAYGRFQRSIQLPFSPDTDHVHANFDNGVLTVTVPRSDKARERGRRIEVRSGAAAKKGESTKH